MKIRTTFSVASGVVILILVSLLSISTDIAVKNTLEEKPKPLSKIMLLYSRQG
ncbi:hypothetical protein [Shewanella psychropiezotolerans]|uniref:hypothetical protein n=1 Tax=Shewanella psychropiezotolerans TaxID=2593655 RepID=UPI00163D9D32|nr:hypothetical protein [Shewanella psychropiezotolerans]